MSDKLDASSAIAGALILPLVAGAVVWGGFVLATLWNWFGAPLAGGYRLLLPEAIGLMCLYGFLALRFSRTPLPSDERPTIGMQAARWASTPLLLLIGYVAHLFTGAH